MSEKTRLAIPRPELPLPLRFGMTPEKLAAYAFRAMANEHDLPPGQYTHRLLTIEEDGLATGFVLEVTAHVPPGEDGGE